MLGTGHDIGGGYIHQRSQVFCQLAHPSPADLFLLSHAEIMGIASDSSIGPPQRNIDDSAFPCHPHGQGSYGIDCFQRMKANSSLRRTPNIVMNHSEATKHPDIPIVQSYRYGELLFSHRIHKEFSRGFIQVKHVSDMIELVLGHLESIEKFFAHRIFPFIKPSFKIFLKSNAL